MGFQRQTFHNVAFANKHGDSREMKIIKHWNVEFSGQALKLGSFHVRWQVLTSDIQGQYVWKL